MNEIDKQIEEAMKRFTKDCDNKAMQQLFEKGLREDYPYGLDKEQWQITE